MDNAGVRRFMIWATLTTVCQFAVWLLSIGIYFLTLYLAYLSSFPALLGALFFPVVAQLYWIWVLWDATGTIFNFFTLLCFALVAFALIGIFARMKAAAVE